MRRERGRYEYRSSHSELFLKIVDPQKLTKSLKNSSEKAQAIVALQARGDKISVPTFASPMALRAKERRK